MKRGRTLPLTGAQLVALVGLFRGRRAPTNVTRPLVRLGFAEWCDDGIPVATSAARFLVAGRIFLAPIEWLDAPSSYDASFAVIIDADVVGYVYHYPAGRKLLAEIETLGPLAAFTQATRVAVVSWMREAIETAAARIVAERRKPRKAIDITEDVDASRPSATL